MKRVILGLCLAAPACGPMPHIDVCKGAAVRRAAYTATIRAADIYAMSGRPPAQAVTLGREAATTALAVLDANCPASLNDQPKEK